MVVMCVTVSTIMIMMICSVSVTGKVSQYCSFYPVCDVTCMYILLFTLFAIYGKSLLIRAPSRRVLVMV